MNVLIFGATGATGRHLVKQALEQNHTVTAFARNPAGLESTHSIQGDVLDATLVEVAVQGQDAVLCALGAPTSDKTMLRSSGTRNILCAMKKAGVERLVCQSSLGFGDSRDILPFHFKYILVPLVLKHAFADHESQEGLIKRSGLRWTIVRPANLTNGGFTGAYKHGFGVTEKIKLKISRADVADFMVRQLSDNTYVHKTPGLSY